MSSCHDDHVCGSNLDRTILHTPTCTCYTDQDSKDIQIVNTCLKWARGLFTVYFGNYLGFGTL